uniref:exosortase Y-associated Wzy-like protein n=1 Tax=Pedobacter sp. TaxID=1411316 RepID=UPI003D7F68F1
MIPKITDKSTLIFMVTIPWVLAELVTHHPLLSYTIAFLGSFYIFYATILSSYRCIKMDRSLSEQIMRPIVLLQLIFAGYMCCTSIFYFIDHLGFEYFRDINYSHFLVNDQTYLLAKSQRMALLGHIALVVGITLQTKTQATVVKFKLRLNLTALIIWLTLITTGIAILMNYVPAFIQLKYYLLAIAASGQAYLLVTGLAHRKAVLILLGGLCFIVHLLNATLTGFKEIILVNLITLGFFAYPHFKKTITILFFPSLYLLLYILPTLTTIVRKESWIGNKSPQTARAEAYELLASGEKEVLIRNNNWAFLTNRFSEIGMFCQYVKHTPAQQPYYRLQILENSMQSLIPRALWDEKPFTEKTAMERVYTAGVVSRLSTVSAKTRTIIDGYLSAGLLGVFT